MTTIDEASQRAFTYSDLNSVEVDVLAERFRSAQPFPHVHIRDFLALPPSEVLPHFPHQDWSGWGRFRDAYQQNKSFCDDIARLPSRLAALIHELCSPSYLEFLEKLTGIQALIPDPYLAGGGLHCSGPGGVLAPHTDFHFYKKLGLFRRINVLVYLNNDWREEYGGCLGLYNKGACAPEVTIVPEWGSCVIFKTDDASVHGFSKPITGDHWRRSIALYYYTSQEATTFSGDADTHWRMHARTSGVGQARLQLYKAMLFGSRCFSRLAHRVNPHFASKLQPTTFQRMP